MAALWGEAGKANAAETDDAAAGSGAQTAPAAVPADLAGDVRATLARAEQALDAAPAEDRAEMTDLHRPRSR